MDTLSGAADLHAVDPTLAPGETIRADSATTTARQLPSLSVDLRELSASGTPSSTADLEVRGVIGEGGMGRVLLARQHSLIRDVAVKTSKSSAGASASAAILLEGEITGSLEHPSIVPVHALGLDSNGQPAMVMKRIEGVAWDALISDPRHPDWENWEGTSDDRLPGHLQILMQVCNALHFAHSRGVVHRDVKPQNVLIGRFGDVYLADWGVATRSGTVATALCGTPAYLAPEMVNGGAVDARTDVYLLGSTLHLLLTGQHRHPGTSVTESLLHARSSPQMTYGPTVPTELAALANRACHVDRAQRPESARAFREALTRYVKHRDARALFEQAQRRVVEVEPLLSVDAPSDEQRTKLERLLSEARFGLEQALVQWPENEAARASLQKVESLVETRSKRLHALEAEMREVDPRRGGIWRTMGLAFTTALVGVTTLFAQRDSNVTPFKVVFFPTLVTLLMALGAFAMRKNLLVTRFNRQVFWLLMTGMAYMCFGRFVGLFLDVEPWVHLSRDAFVISAVTMAAMVFLRWMWPMALLFLAAGVWCMAEREHSILIFAWTTVLALAISTWISWRESRASASGEVVRK
ncbi:MAG: protein kinase [Archangium sp.]